MTERSLLPASLQGLELCGFLRRGDRWLLPAHPDVGIAADSSSSSWLRVVSDPVALPDRTGSCPLFLDGARAPAAPVILLPATTDDEVRLAADLPRDELAPVPEAPAGDEPLEQELQGILESATTDAGSTGVAARRRLWGELYERALTGLLDPTKRPPGAPDVGEPPSPDLLLDRVRRSGWPASRKEDEIRVDVEHRHFRRHVRLIPEAAGLRLALRLVETEAWSPTCLAAAVRLAAVSLTRLRLVRIVQRPDEPARPFEAEVHLASLPIESPWLSRAIVALDEAARLLAETLPALADESLAQAFLEATSASVPFISGKEVCHEHPHGSPA